MHLGFYYIVDFLQPCIVRGWIDILGGGLVVPLSGCWEKCKVDEPAFACFEGSR